LIQYVVNKVSFNSEKLLVDCLTRNYQQTTFENWELIF